jgi:hypothetical protein
MSTSILSLTMRLQRRTRIWSLATTLINYWLLNSLKVVVNKILGLNTFLDFEFRKF